MTTVWITGGGSGIGAALARQLNAQGYTVYVSGRDENKLRSVGEGIHPLVCDVTDPDQIAQVLNEIDLPDLAIFNAGAYDPGPTHSTTMAEFRRTMEVNYFGLLNCLHAVLPRMQERRTGHIGVVASVAGYRGLPNAAGYGPSKAATLSLCESIRAELGDSSVKFQVINPGFVKTPLTDKNDFDMPFLMEPGDAARAIVKGMKRNQFEIAFPRPFVCWMKFARLLPYRLYFSLMRKVVRK